jgi:hypothetical protein
MTPDCSLVQDDLADLVAGDSATIARHADHLASCDDCRDARHEAAQLANALGAAGADHVAPMDLVERVLAAAGSGLVPASHQVAGAAMPSAGATLPMPAMTPTVAPAPATAPLAQGSTEIIKPYEPVKATPAAQVIAPANHDAPIPITSAKKSRSKLVAIGSIAALAVGGIGIYAATRGDSTDTNAPIAGKLPTGKVATVKAIDRAAKTGGAGLEMKAGNSWRPLRVSDTVDAGTELRTDERTRAAVELEDGTRFVLDHNTTLTFDGSDVRKSKLVAGRVVADVMHPGGTTGVSPVAVIDTPAGRVDVVGTKFALTATDKLTVVQVVRGEVILTSTGGAKDSVRAGEEGVIDNGTLAVNAAPGLAREVEWSELGETKKDTQTGAGLGALRAYKPGESRDRDWNLALASHDIKVRIVGPVARTEIVETFRNDSDQTLEGVYQFPLPADAQIDGLSLDVKDAPGGFEEGAFLDKQRAQKIWNGVIEKATEKKLEIARDEIIWVDGSWRDPALLDWKRGGRFELRIFPIPPKGSRTIKIAYTQVVTPRGPYRQYVYPLPHSADGSTVADNLTVDVEVRGAQQGQIRAAGYDLNPDPARADVNALTMKQTGFVPRGDLVVDYKATDGDAELRAWAFTGGFAVPPDEKLAEKKNVGIDPKVIDEQRKVAADARPTAVVALRPKLPRWREAREHDYLIVVDSSQSMVGERYTRATELTTRLVEQMDRRDRFTVMACDSECREFGAMRTPSVGNAKEAASWLTAQSAAGASDIVAAIRTAASKLPAEGQRERWVLFVGDGFASTGFRKSGDIEKAVAEATKGINVSTIGLGTDADAAVLGAVARAGGGSYLAWVPGQSVKTMAVASLESTFGSALRNATVELPQGLVDVAPTVLPTVRTGEEVLIAARLTGDVEGDVIVKGTVGGEKFEQRYPLKLAVSAGAGNRFVPRLWAALAIEQLERKGNGEDRAKVVALSQGFGVMSKETSLLVLESAAMFEAFGVDRSVPSAKFTGRESLDEVVSSGSLALNDPQARDDREDNNKSKKSEMAKAATSPAKKPPPAEPTSAPSGDAAGAAMPQPKPVVATRAPAQRRTMDGRGSRGGMFAMRRTWIRVPSVSAYDSVAPSITKAIGDAERALAKSPDSRERHRALVQALSYAGEIDRAHAVAAKWLDRDRLDPQALGYQADLLGRDGKRDEALRLLAGVTDLDADRVATHERMVTAYEHVGRMSQACSHRIALSAIQPKDGKAGAAAVRCLRTLSRDTDAQLIITGLADEATRAATEKALLSADPAASSQNVAALRGGDLVVDARWEGGADLDVSLVTPDGTRVSWMGGRTDVRVADATSTAKEQLTLKSLKRGHYLLEVARGAASSGTVRGTIDVVVLGTKKSIPFELVGPRKTVARVSVNLEERVETIDMSAPVVVTFGSIPNPAARRVMLARSGSIQQCFDGTASGRMMLIIKVDNNGSTTTLAQGGGTDAQRACVSGQLSSMHVEGTAAGTFRVPLTFQAKYSAD